MSFGLFVGVNNHFQTVLLGGVLMTDEKIDSFKWVFREFSSLMGGWQPKTILKGTATQHGPSFTQASCDTIFTIAPNQLHDVIYYFTYLISFISLPDQCRAMEVAIAEEWPNTVHRWCKWHVLKRVRECVGQKYTSNKEFRDRFHMMLNEMLTIEEFETSWSILLKQYGLEKNAFLTQIYETMLGKKLLLRCVLCENDEHTKK